MRFLIPVPPNLEGWSMNSASNSEISNPLICGKRFWHISCFKKWIRILINIYHLLNEGPFILKRFWGSNKSRMSIFVCYLRYFINTFDPKSTVFWIHSDFLKSDPTNSPRSLCPVSTLIPYFKIYSPTQHPSSAYQLCNHFEGSLSFLTNGKFPIAQACSAHPLPWVQPSKSSWPTHEQSIRIRSYHCTR